MILRGKYREQIVMTLNVITYKGPSRSDKLRFFLDLAQKLGKNVEKMNIIVA